MARPPEMELRKKVHAFCVRKDKHYRGLGTVHMNEVSGVVTIEWFDSEGRKRYDTVMYGKL